MQLIALLLLAASLYAADPPAEASKAPTVAVLHEPTFTAEELTKQLADAKSEIAALRQHITEYQAWTQKAFTILEGQWSAAVNSCLGPPPQVPAPKAK